MLLNFLDPCLSPNVKCGSPAEDDYSEQNLIADSHTAQYFNGFMAYSVVKPPVELFFSLICPIELHAISLKSRIGSLKSNGFEISVKVSQKHSSADDEMKKVGQLYNLKDDGCVFFNTFTTEKHKSDLESLCAGLHKSPMFLNLRRGDMVTHIRIIIKSTERCVPVLKHVKIFGLPARSMPAIDRNLIFIQWANKYAKFEPISKQINTANDTLLPQSSHKPADPLQSVNVPDEFLDSITFEIMSLPMILPSGKIVDKSTLDRHSHTEESCWGRAPSDPFTGVAFTANSKPIFNDSLKSQIDQFLLLHQHHPDLKTIPRTVGTFNNKRPKHLTYPTHESAKRLCTTSIQQPNSAENSECFSLETSVENALKSITRFTTITKTSIQMASDCFVCTSKESLYKIRSCGHLKCRPCLLDAKQNTKCACGVKFLSTDVIRHYQKTIG